MKDKNKLTKTEQKYYDAIKESGIVPIPAEDIYFAVKGEVGGRRGILEAELWVSKIRRKLGQGSIVNRHGFGYLTEEDYRKSLERMTRLSSGEKE